MKTIRSTPETPAPPVPLELVREEPAEPAAARRHVSAWDLLGIVAAAFAMLLVNRLAIAYAGTDLGRSRWIQLATVGSGVASAAGLVVLAVRDRPRLSKVPALLTGVWRDPPRDWVVFALGMILATPLLGIYLAILFGDSDSARLIASIKYVQRGHLGYFADTQEPLLPHILLGPFVALGGLAGAKMFAIVSVQALAGAIAQTTYRITGSMWGAAASVAGLLALSPIFERAAVVPMYPTMLALGCIGSWYGYRVMSTAQPSWRHVVAAAACLALAPEAHGVGQIFLVMPIVLLVFTPSVRAGVLNLVRVYGVMTVVLLPRIAINLSKDGLSFVTTNRTDYWITKGYVYEIQTNFWHYIGVNEPLDEYLRALPGRYYESLGDQAWLVLVFAGVGWLLFTRGRGRWFAVGAFGLMLAAVTVKQVPPFPRYYSPLWPGMAILVGVLAASVARRRSWLPRAVPVLGATVCLAALVGAATITYRDAAHRWDVEGRRLLGSASPKLAAVIDDGRGVIGARSHAVLTIVDDEIPTWGDQFLTEREYITYLTWPSDDEVIAMLERHDIGWVLIHPMLHLEVAYNDTWLVRHYGVQARHVEAVAESPRFCLRSTAAGFRLYQLEPCVATASAPPVAPTPSTTTTAPPSQPGPTVPSEADVGP